MELYKGKKEQLCTYIVFSIYFLLLIWLVVFKFTTRLDELPNLRAINLIPFYYDQENSMHFKEVLYNVMVFIPAGFYLSAFFSRKNVLLGTAATVLISLSFEIIQWIFSIGASDITDIITNSLGGLCGMLLFMALGKITAKHRMTIVNVLGIIIEVLAGLMLVLLYVSN